MKILLCVLLLCLSLVASDEKLVVTNTDGENAPVTLWVTGHMSDRTVRTKYIAWNMLCFDLRDVDCTGIPVPNLKLFRPLPQRPNLLGYYDGSDTIYVRNNLRGRALEEVLTHEMSHYADMFVIPGFEVPGYARSICFSEKRAWAVSDAYHVRYGYPRKVVGERWVNWYSHCRKYRDDLYPKD